MSWNGSNNTAKVEGQGQARKGGNYSHSSLNTQHSSLKHGAIAGLAVVALGGAAVWWFFGRGGSQGTDRPTGDVVKKGAIAEATPAVVPQVTNEVVKIDPKKMPHPRYKQPTNPNLPKKKYIPTIEEVENARLGPDGKPRKMSIYKTPIEQALGMIFTTPLGSMPPILPDIPRFTSEEQLNKFLETKFEYDKDAPQAVNENRIMMEKVRTEFKNYLAEGGDIQGFVDYYVGELRASYDQWKTAQKMVVDMAREGESPETLRAFRDKADALLAEKGIKKLAFPPSIRKAMGEE